MGSPSKICAACARSCRGSLRRLFKEGFGWESRIRGFEREAEKLQGDAAQAMADKAAALARTQQIHADIAKTEQEYLQKGERDPASTS